MKKICLHFFLASLPLFSFAQWHDKLWISIVPGQDAAPSDPPFPATWTFFDSSSPRLIFAPTPYPGGYACNLTMCNDKGIPLFFSNGHNIFHVSGPLMENGDSLAPIIFQAGYPFGDPARFSLMGVPRLVQDGNYFIVQLYKEPNWDYVPKLLLSRISGATALGLGKVDYKNKVIFTGHNLIDFFNATKHANGRDWWVVFSDIDLVSKTRTFHSIYLGPDTAYIAQSQVINGYEPVPDAPWEVLTVQRIFSPDGNYFIALDATHGIRIHSFDRCTGTLGPLITLPYQMGNWGAGGIAVSPNSRFLYVSNSNFVFQYDLQSTDIISTIDTVGVYDGFIEPSTGQSTTFSACQLNADGKIYFFVGGRKQVHYIANPNNKDCKFKQRGFEMPMVTEIFPFYPNYRLGPLDGSTCDTLGLNNEPLADFWWLSDSTLTMEFSDNSFYEPVEWHWDFGDGGISQDTSPAHTFPAAGTYNVCLTVSNQYAADTVCKDVTVGVTGLQDLPVLPRVQVSPNPFGAWLHISLPVLLHEQPRFTLFDVFGKEQASVRLQDFETHLDLPRLPAGVYFWQLRFHGVVTQTGKLIRVE